MTYPGLSLGTSFFTKQKSNDNWGSKAKGYRANFSWKNFHIHIHRALKHAEMFLELTITLSLKYLENLKINNLI